MTNDIYTYIFDNFNIKVTDYTFKRDYIQNPLKKCDKEPLRNRPMLEKPHRVDLEFVYVNCGLSIEDMRHLFNVTSTTLRKWIKYFNIQKPMYLIMNNRDKKSKRTCLEKYGVESPLQNDVFLKKKNRTCLEKYGYENVCKSSVIKNKWKQTLMDNYGVDSPLKSEEIMNKKIKTCLEKYGCKNPLQNNEVYDKLKKTNLKKYGYEISILNEDVKNKKLKTNLKKYGCENPLQNEVIKKKQLQTMLNNKTINISKTEDDIYNLLVKIFKTVNRQYVSDIYPFPCDFYIPKIDLYIEYNGHWTHGKEPYIGTDEQIEKVKLWESKSNDCQQDYRHNQYKRAIDTWTKRDVLKRTIANNNDLNYLEFFNKDEFNKWFETINH